jgi:hypothetical protein
MVQPRAASEGAIERAASVLQSEIYLQNILETKFDSTRW